MIFLFLLFLLPGILLFIKTIQDERKAERVTGTIIEVIPQYRGSRYRVSIPYDNTLITRELSPNHNFQFYKMDHTVDVCVIHNKSGYKFKFSKGLYVLPIVILFAGLFMSLIFYGILQ